MDSPGFWSILPSPVQCLHERLSLCRFAAAKLTSICDGNQPEHCDKPNR
jgi:hypothetical protein